MQSGEQRSGLAVSALCIFVSVVSAREVEERRGDALLRLVCFLLSITLFSLSLSLSS